ncbi:unnamed protein product [Prorocentrum cordatum]|uniref:Uncharacterized protein n=1 Tax=Prorocentrum cordatum TaxID=2364126 RepID=A0ABN9RK80_9DINO|nr:unnamed protein product [Polarella glacialis]
MFERAVDAMQTPGPLAQRHAERASKLEFQQILNVSQASEPAVTIEYHSFWHDPSSGAPREWRCRACSAVARTDHDLGSLRAKEMFKRCEPTQVLSWAADAFFYASQKEGLIEAKPSVLGAYSSVS